MKKNSGNGVFFTLYRYYLTFINTNGRVYNKFELANLA